MRRDQLEHAIRTACKIIQHPAVIILGSQSILGTYREEDLPPEATMSLEIDVPPISNTNEETNRLAYLCGLPDQLGLATDDGDVPDRGL